MSFIKSKKLGDTGENLLLAELKTREKYVNVGLNENKETRKDYDVWADDGKVKWTFEVKYDFYAEKSGNVALEYFNSKKNQPSGITATKANYWVHILNENGNPVLYIVTVKSLKDFITNSKPHRIINSGGDNNADLYLYKKEDILPIFSCISEWNL